MDVGWTQIGCGMRHGMGHRMAMGREHMMGHGTGHRMAMGWDMGQGMGWI